MSTQTSLNPWNYKPWWCQPWSILLTGVTIIFSSWLLAKTIWVTLLISIPVVVWMGYFLLIWPRLMRRYMENSLSDGVPQPKD
ncbi:MAG TPA: DUF6737 family protein [Oculatellaceae cyanobacterium]